MNELLAGLHATGVVRVSGRGGNDADLVELRSKNLLDIWETYQKWQEPRRALRTKVEDWIKRQRPNDRLLDGQELEEALSYRDRNGLEREFTDKSREYKGRSEGQREIAVRKQNDLQLDQRAARFQAGDNNALLDNEKELVLAENWRDSPEVKSLQLLAPAIDRLIKESRNQATRRENDKLKRQRTLLRLLAVSSLLVAILIGMLARGFYYTGKEADDAQRLTKELMDAHDLWHRSVNAIPIADTDPHRFLALGLDVCKQADALRSANKGQWDAETRERLRDLHQQLDLTYANAGRDAMICANESLQLDFTGLIFRPEEGKGKYEVNSVAFNNDASLVAAACSDGRIRVWKYPGDRHAVELLPPLQVPGTPVAIGDVAFGGPEGQWLAAACGNGGVRVWFDLQHSDKRESMLVSREGRGSWSRVAWSQEKGSDRPPLLVASADDKDNPPDEGGMYSWSINEKSHHKDSVPVFDEERKEKKVTAISAIALGRGGRLFAAPASGGELLSWNLELAGWKGNRSFAPVLLECTRLVIGDLVAGEKDNMAVKTPVLLGACEDGTARVWLLDTNGTEYESKGNNPVQVLVIRHPCPVRGVTAFPVPDQDGNETQNLIATAGRDSKVRLWRLTNRGLTDLIQRHGQDRPLTEWQTADNFTTLAGHTGKLTAVISWLDRETKRLFLASSSDDGTVRSWDLLPCLSGPVAVHGYFGLNHFSFSPSLDNVAICPREDNPAARGPFLRSLQPDAISYPGLPNKTVGLRRIAFHPDAQKRLWATLDKEGAFKLWKADGGPDPLDKRTLGDMGIDLKDLGGSLLPPLFGRIMFSLMGHFVAFSLTENTVLVYGLGDDSKLTDKPLLGVTKDDLRRWAKEGIKTNPAEDVTVYGFALDEKHRQLALACSWGRILIIDFSDIKSIRAKAVLIRPLKGPMPAINDVSFSPNGDWLAAASADALVRILNVHDTSEIQVLRRTDPDDNSKNGSQKPPDAADSVHTMEVKRISYHPLKDTELASGGDDELLCIWRKTHKGWDLSYRFDAGGTIQALSYNQDGNRIGVATSSGKVSVYWLNPEELIKVAEDRLRGSLAPR